MRRIILAFSAVLLLLPGVVTASASGGDVLSAQSEALDLDGWRTRRGTGLPGMELEAGLSLDEGLRSIVDTGSGELFGVVRKAVRSGVLLLAVVLLCGLAEGLYAGTGAGRAVDVVSIVGALAVAAVAAADANTLIGLGREALDNMSTFSKLPAAHRHGGGGRRRLPRRGRWPGSWPPCWFSDVLITLITQLLLPLVYAYIAACVAHAAVGNEGLKRIAGTLKWLVTAVLTTVLVVFVGYLTVSGVIAGTTGRGDRQGGQVHHVQPGARGGRHPVRRGGDRAGRGGHPEKRGGGVSACWRCWPCAWCPSSSWGSTTWPTRPPPPSAPPCPAAGWPGSSTSWAGPSAWCWGMTGSCALLLLISLVSRHHGGGEVRPCWS